MAEHEENKDLPPDGGEVEIIEVVAVQEETSEPPAAPEEEDPARAAPAARSELEPEEFVLSLDEAEKGVEVESDLIIRLRADYDNLRKRIDREREEYRRNANTRLLGRLLPILDNFERALGVESKVGSAGALHSGVEMIYRQLSEELRREGLEVIEATGGPFDPNLHDAVETEPSASHPPNTVIAEFQRGYLFRGRLLRPAMVKVSTSEDSRSGGDGTETGSK